MIVGRPQGVMPSRLRLPRSLYDFSVRDFPTIFLKSIVIMGYDVFVYNSYGHRSISCSSFFDVLSRNCLEIVGKSKGLCTL